MSADSPKPVQLSGLELLFGAQSFLDELSQEDQAAISGGRRRCRRSRSRSRSRISKPSRISPSDRYGGRRAVRRGGRRRARIA